MSWDAYAYRSVEHYLHNSKVFYQNSVLSPHLDSEMRTIFEQANASLRKLTGDGGQIVDGELGGSLTKVCLKFATSVSCEPDKESGLLMWSSETVQEAEALADWDFDVEKLPVDDGGFDRDWYEYVKCETRLFLQVCAQNKYAILFSE